MAERDTTYEDEYDYYRGTPNFGSPGPGAPPQNPSDGRLPGAKPPDRPGGHYEELPNGGWRWVADDAPPGQTGQTGQTLGNGPGGTNYPWINVPPQTNSSGSGGGARPSFNFRSPPPLNLPEFSYAAMPAIDKFAAPTGDKVLQEPGYEFREKQGRQALEQSAAGRGTLRTGGTLKDLIAYGQQFASNEYGNVYNRAKGEYDTDVDNKFRTFGTNYGVGRDVFDRGYTRAKDMYAPTFAEWQMQQQAELQGGLSAFDRSWQEILLANGGTQADIDRILKGMGQ